MPRNTSGEFVIIVLFINMLNSSIEPGIIPLSKKFIKFIATNVVNTVDDRIRLFLLKKNMPFVQTDVRLSVCTDFCNNNVNTCKIF